MSAPLTSGPYHLVKCDRTEEAAALIAALSRFLDSPPGAVAPGAVVEIWATVSGDPQGVTLYLSPAAFAALQQAFPPVPVVAICPGAARPSSAILLLGGHTRRAMGMEEVHRY